MLELGRLILKLIKLGFFCLESDGLFGSPLELLQIVIEINVVNSYVSLNLLALAKLSCKNYKQYDKCNAKSCCDYDEGGVVKLKAGCNSTVAFAFAFALAAFAFTGAAFASFARAAFSTFTAGAAYGMTADSTLAVLVGVRNSGADNTALALGCMTVIVNIVACVKVVGVIGNNGVSTLGTFVIYDSMRNDTGRFRTVCTVLPVSLVVILVVTVAVRKLASVDFYGVLSAADASTGLGSVVRTGCIVIGYVVFKYVVYLLRGNMTLGTLSPVIILIGEVFSAVIVLAICGISVSADGTYAVDVGVRTLLFGATILTGVRVLIGSYVP